MYDPLIDNSPPSHLTKPDSFWANDYDPFIYPTLERTVNTDIAIIGAGYTGLSAAMHLRREYGVDCTVIEACQPGVGSSGRNGGFVLPGTGRLSNEQCVERFGEKTTAEMYQEYQRSVDFVDALIDQLALQKSQQTSIVDCARTRGGYLKLAHHQQHTQQLHQQVKYMQKNHGENAQPLTQKDIESNYLSGVQQFGGVYYPNAFSVNPWLLVQGIAKLTQNAGVQIFGNSPVIDIKTKDSTHEIITRYGKVKAKTLLLASNAYTPNHQFSILQNRIFPVISSIIVTKPLSTSQLSLLNMKPGLMVMDTRPLKYYYRLLPDNRLLFGGRGAVTGKKAYLPRYQSALVQGLLQTLPGLKNIEIDQFWSGWVAISFDDYPRLYFDKAKQCLYSAGYCGAGLAFSLYAGKRLAQLYAEPEAMPDLPFWQTPLKKFPLAMLRRPALNALYFKEHCKQWLQRHFS